MPWSNYWDEDGPKFSDLVGKVISSVEGLERGSEEVIFETVSGDKYKLYHQQDCCEDVYIEDVCGYPCLLEGREVLMAEESSNKVETYQEDESATWTFYRISNKDCTIVIRWYGKSNGYYSERAKFVKWVED